MGFLLMLAVSSCKSGTGITVYPLADSLVISPDFTVKANNIDINVERTGSKLDTLKYSLYNGRAGEDLNVAWFACSGPVKIEITASSDIESFLIRPKSRKIEAVAEGKILSFELDGPQNLYIEINDLPHLAIFADTPEQNPPNPKAKNTVYFGPGIHNPGKIELQSNQTVYLAAGAVVNANIRGDSLENVTIHGRGIINGNIRINRTDNLKVEGIFMRNRSGWTNTLTDCHNSSYRNVKVFGYEAIYSVDGINPVSCTNFTIDNCFMRCRDDCVAIKSMDYDLRVDSIFVTNCVMVGWCCSDGITIGFELNGSPVQNVFVKNCDILFARGGGRTGGHSGFSIVCDGPAIVQNINYEDIRIEEQVEFKNLELIVTDGKLYGEDLPGHIKGVHMKNITWENPLKPFIIQGFSAENMIEDITFEKCFAGGVALTDTTNADFIINEYVRNVQFLQ